MTRDFAVLQLRIEGRLKSEFAEAARAQNATPSEAMRDLIAGYVRESRRREAQRQSLVVAAAADAEDTMDEIMRLQEWLFD